MIMGGSSSGGKSGCEEHNTKRIHSFEMFCVATNGDIDEYTYSVTAYISKCVDDVIPKVNARTFPNQKPWVNVGVRAKLKAWSSAYSSRAVVPNPRGAPKIAGGSRGLGRFEAYV